PTRLPSRGADPVGAARLAAPTAGRRRAPGSAQQLLDRFGTLVDDADGPVVRRGVLLVVVDTQDRADGGQEVNGRGPSLDHAGAFLVGLADHLSALDAATHQDRAPGARVVVAA